MFLVKKKTASGSGVAHRGILDARRLNSASIHRQVYMGSVQQNLSSLEKADLYTNLDIASFFNSIKLSETPADGHIYSSVDYCSFQTHSLGSGISALVTQTQKFTEEGKEIKKEVLVGSISRKCPPSLRNATSCRGEAAALTLALTAFANILQNHHFLLHSDHLSLLYLKGLKSMNGQLWRLFEEITKYSFTMIHVRQRDNGLADAHSRRTNLPELTKEEAELFGDIIEELDDEGKVPLHQAGGAEKRKKGEPRQRSMMSEAQEQQAKRQQLKQIRYAKLLNRGFALRQEQVGEVEEAAHIRGGLTLGGQDARRHHRARPRGGVPSTELLHCAKECQHQSGWLPRANGRTEQVCVSRRGEENCGATDDWTREGLEELEGEEEQHLAPDNPLLKAVGGRLRGHVADCISPEEVVEKQKSDQFSGRSITLFKRGLGQA